MPNTVNRGYPKPDENNFVSSDVLLLIQSFDMIDADVAGLSTGLAGKAAAVHTHGMNDITGLVDAIAGRAAANHNHTLASLSDTAGLALAPDGYVLRKTAGTWQAVAAATLFAAHQHAIGDINGLPQVLESKLDAAALAGAATKGVPADADTFGISDNPSGGGLRRLSFANLWSWIKSKADPIYAAIGHGHAITDTQGLQLVLASKADINSLPLRQYYESSPQVIGGLLTLAHGLSGKPRVVTLSIVCTTANQGYSVGDEVLINPAAWDGSKAWGVWFDATTINVRTGALSIGGKATGGGTIGAGWSLIVRALA